MQKELYQSGGKGSEANWLVFIFFKPHRLSVNPAVYITQSFDIS